jgi:hypothetical protein
MNPTHGATRAALPANNRAVDGADTCNGPDQRGWEIPGGGNGDGTVACDIGAVERKPASVK